MADFVPDDVVVGILSRLPPKSLIRFRSVSNHWNSLITSPTFIGSHLTHSLSSPNKNSYNNLPLSIVRQCLATSPPHTRTEHYKLFIDTQEKGEEGEERETFVEYREIPFPIKSRRLHYFMLIGYVKGLFCLFEQDKYFLWNPSIRKSLTLPKPCINKKQCGSFVTRQGFGFDPRSNDHKVVRFAIICGSKPSEDSEVPLVEVYSVNSGSWRIVASGASESFPVGYRIGYWGMYGACLHGALHFVAERRRNGNDKMIILFDLGDEVFRTMTLPNGIASVRADISSKVFGGLLTLFCHEGDRANKSCSIWIMKEYGEINSWYKYAKVDITGGIRDIVGIQNNGHVLLVGDAPGQWELSSYDPGNQTVTNLGIYGSFSHFHVDRYEENLVLLKKTSDAVSARGGSRKRKDRWTLDQSTLARMEVQIDIQRLEREFDPLLEKVKGMVEVAHDAMETMGSQQRAELSAKLQTIFQQILRKDVGNEEIDSTRLNATSQGSAVNDCDVAEKMSHGCVPGRDVSVKRKHLNGSCQGYCNKDCTGDEVLEALRDTKARYAKVLEQITQLYQLMQIIVSLKVPTVPGLEGR